MSAQRPHDITDIQLRAALTRLPDSQRMAADLALIVATVERTRQRRTTASRWLLMAAVLTVLALLLATIGLALIAGSSQHVLRTTGPARTGLLAMDIDGDIWLANADGTGRRRLTSGPAVDWQPLWSPDGTKLVYWTAIDQNHPRQLVLQDMKDPSSSGPSVVGAADNSADGRVSWSPDSRRLAYSDAAGGVSWIEVVNLDSRIPVEIGPPRGNNADPAWSPDGRLIAFLGHRSDVGRGLYVMAPDGTNVRRISTLTSRGNGFLVPVWSPDGKRLAYASETGGSDPFERDIWVVGLDGAAEVDISNDPGDESDPAWSPDGGSVAYIRHGEVGQARWKIVVSRVDGTHSAALPPDVLNGTVVWSPDGKSILAYELNPLNDGADSVIAIDPATGQAVVIAVGSPAGVGSWQRLAP